MMARPPVEWPIPQYVVELRERVIVTCRVPARLLAERVPPPLSALTAAGEGVVSLAIGAVRCIKSVGGVQTLASELHTAELFTPARWRPACRRPLTGNLLLDLWTDSPGLARLVRTALGFRPRPARYEQCSDRGAYRCRLTSAEGDAELHVIQPGVEAAWPARSAFTSHEAAEAQLVHPECLFVPSGAGDAVYAVPVHQYARSTTHAAAARASAPLMAALGAASEEVIPDHVFFQKRCTHTVLFPPERIATVPQPGSRPPVSSAALSLA
jgi:hypothetical protein